MFVLCGLVLLTPIYVFFFHFFVALFLLGRSHEAILYVAFYNGYEHYPYCFGTTTHWVQIQWKSFWFITASATKVLSRWIKYRCIIAKLHISFHKSYVTFFFFLLNPRLFLHQICYGAAFEPKALFVIPFWSFLCANACVGVGCVGVGFLCALSLPSTV